MHGIHFIGTQVDAFIRYKAHFNSMCSTYDSYAINGKEKQKEEGKNEEVGCEIGEFNGRIIQKSTRRNTHEFIYLKDGNCNAVCVQNIKK